MSAKFDLNLMNLSDCFYTFFILTENYILLQMTSVFLEIATMGKTQGIPKRGKKEGTGMS